HYTDFPSFLSFLGQNQFTFETKTDELIKNLRTVAGEEAYSKEVSGEVDNLKAIVEKEKSAQVKLHEKPILKEIEREILTRYYFETGLVRHQLKNDPELAEAIAILKSPTRYQQVLSGK
ncbi:MAG: hypothetical protein M3R25_15920, partial [Bacteroidota bacterium]|nr:hypothetical protein [Bacteroidota bacterium]